MPRLREEELMAYSKEEGGRFYLIWVGGGGQGAIESKRQAKRAE